MIGGSTLACTVEVLALDSYSLDEGTHAIIGGAAPRVIMCSLLRKHACHYGRSCGSDPV